uniref:mRNA m(6)A methyltransferase n=1 Tax=Aceria tosichella TaxID=561515 RepID=A0A6G1SPW5_9ACAR
MDSINNAPKLGGDAWLELQAFKTRQINRREKLNRHKDLINGIPGAGSSAPHNIINNNNSISKLNPTTPTTGEPNNHNHLVNNNRITSPEQQQLQTNLRSDEINRTAGGHSEQQRCDQVNRHNEANQSTKVSSYQNDLLNQLERTGVKYCDNSYGSPPSRQNQHQTPIDVEAVECLLLLKLCDVALKLPIDSRSLQRSITKIRGFERTTQAIVENLLQKLAHQELIIIEEPSAVVLSRSKNHQIGMKHDDDEICTYVVSADHTKLVEFNKAFGSSDSIRALLLDEAHNDSSLDDSETPFNNRSSHGGKLNETDVEINSNKTQLDLQQRASNNISRSSPDTQKSLRLDGELTRSSRRGGQTSDATPNKQLTKGDDVESLLSLSSTREKESKKLGEELLELLSKPTAKERNLLERFRSADGYQVQEFCPKGTKDECRRNGDGVQACDKLHFKKIIAKHTEESLGDCSFLNTCFHMDSCKYVHYEVDYDEKQAKHYKHHKTKSLVLNTTTTKDSNANSGALAMVDKSNGDPVSGGKKSTKELNKQPNQDLQQAGSSKPVSKYALSAEEQARIDIRNRKRFKTVLYPPQWIQCDLRYFDMSLLGKFSVVMADPPWDIHMELPYGTMSDDEMRKLNVPALQDEGVIFLWVTGRAMELGRECLALWGYERCDEIIWVKTNQLQRIIRTGRTGHWLNHGKEHCLVGIKGNPTEMNRGLDCDIIVAEVRATSHKPDEIYGIIERLSPGTRKIELFGRAHNVQPNWITLGNQLDGVRLVEPTLIEAFKKLNLPYQTGGE